jgi:hypothetical protein
MQTRNAPDKPEIHLLYSIGDDIIKHSFLYENTLNEVFKHATQA